MLVRVLAAALFVGPAPPPAIAVQWRVESAEVELREGLREAVAARDGRPLASVRDRALERAREAVSRELPIELRELRRATRARLDRADAAYREGRFDDARAEIADALEQLRATPVLPGAAASAREAHLLAAKVAWALGEPDVADRSLADALRLDPEAQLSVREAAPELVEHYHALQDRLVAERDATWIAPTIDPAELGEAPGFEVEIDGVPGLRAVPPGPHFLVVYRAGHTPLASFRSVEQPWTVAIEPPRLPDDPDATIAAVCEILELDVLLLAEQRGPRVGLQGYACGRGAGPLWTGPREQLAAGVEVALAGPFERSDPTLPRTWPTVVPEPDPPTTEPDPRPWYRRGWIWGTSAGVAAAVAGGIVAGVVLAGREQPPASLEVDSGMFIGGF